jgi:hypothetical protein
MPLSETVNSRMRNLESVGQISVPMHPSVLLELGSLDACFQNVACTSLGPAFELCRQSRCRLRQQRLLSSGSRPLLSSVSLASQHSSAATGFSAVHEPSYYSP